MEVGNLVWRLQFNVSSLSSVQSHSHGQLFATPGTAARQASLSFTISPNLLKLMSIESVMMSNHLIHCPHLLQYFPASESFQISQFFSSGGQSIVVSASASVLPMDIQDWSPLGWTGWISLQSKGLSRVFSNITVQKHQSVEGPNRTNGKGRANSLSSWAWTLAVLRHWCFWFSGLQILGLILSLLVSLISQVFGLRLN